MKRFRAVFLDRDGTISRNNLKLWEERDQYIRELLNVEHFALTPELSGKMFAKISNEYLDASRVTTLDAEETFWQRWYQCILEEYGVKKKAELLAAKLNTKYPFHEMKEPYPETLDLLRYLKERGYRIGVISDTFPSLEKSLHAMGIGAYFKACIASSAVGVMKPEPPIYQAALRALQAEASESIYVDDYDIEADGARRLGFTAFHLDRKRAEPDLSTWTIATLTDLITFLENHSHPIQP